MAIDTTMKRFSMLNMATPHVYPRLFQVDGAIDADDRAFLLHLYGGNAFEAPAAVVGIDLTLSARDSAWTLSARDSAWTLRTRVLGWTLKDR